MTKKQALDKIKTLLNSRKSYIINEAERLLETGAIDLETWPNDYLIPRAVLHVAQKNIIASIGVTPSMKPTIENLEKF